ncbi:hypothetical protein FOZ61_001229, partial [Perkinsus olseni]
PNISGSCVTLLAAQLRVLLDYREANLFSLRGGHPQNNLHGTLLLLRSSEYFVAGDLSKAFCRMQSNYSDIPYVGYTCIGPFTVLWARVGFGTRSAPNMLDSTVDDATDEIYHLTQLVRETDGNAVELDLSVIEAAKIKDCLLYPSDKAFEYLCNGPPIPSGIKMLKFVDDIYVLGSSVAEAQRNYGFVSYVLKGHDLPAEDLKKFENWLSQLEGGIEKRGHLLGYDYLPSNDGLYPTMSADPSLEPLGPTSMTKRSASSALASLYDPLGLLIEHDILGRSIWRSICQETKEWDVTISHQLQQHVVRWTRESTRICTMVSTPRYLPYDSELILSTDASKDAWGADLRLKSHPDVRLSAKGGLYVTANLSWSIPRKELDALHRGLLWVRTLSAYLPITTVYGKNQAPVNNLSPEVPIYPLVVAIDSELTVYRLRRPANDERLPSPEKRRLQAVRDLCAQLNATVRHIPSGCNPADSISRYSMGRIFDGTKLPEAIDSSKVIYDPGSLTLMIETTDPNLCGGCHLINCDGLDIPDIDKTDLTAEMKDELRRLARHIDTSRGSDADLSSLQDNIEFNDDLNTCLRRCQSEDEDLAKFRDYLSGHVPRGSVGMRTTTFNRMEHHCHLDPNGIIRQRPWYEGPSREDDDADGMIYLGVSRYARLVCSLLCAIYHYILSHPGRRKLRLYLQRRFMGRGLSKIISKTTSSCTLCLKARASKAIRYANNAVQDMVVTQLWQLVGIDILGPYGRASTRNRGGDSHGENTYLLDPSKDYYALVCQDAVSGFIASRPLRNCKGPTIAAAIHSIFCEHGPPSVALCDKAHGSILSKAVISMMAKHRCRLYCLPGYSAHLSFWERAHRDLTETARTISGSSEDAMEQLYNLMLAIRIYNCSPKHWTYMSPSYLHYSYGGRLPGDAPPSTIDYDKLDSRYLNAEYLPFARGLLPVLSDYQERMRSSVEEYVEAWRQKQADLRERYIKETPQCDQLAAFDLATLAAEPLDVQ